MRKAQKKRCHVMMRFDNDDAKTDFERREPTRWRKFQRYALGFIFILFLSLPRDTLALLRRAPPLCITVAGAVVFAFIVGGVF